MLWPRSARPWWREVTYYRCRQGFGRLKTEQVNRLKDLKLENSWRDSEERQSFFSTGKRRATRGGSFARYEPLPGLAYAQCNE